MKVLLAKCSENTLNKGKKRKKTTFVPRERKITNATILNISGELQSFIVKLYIYKKDIRVDIRLFGL